MLGLLQTLRDYAQFELLLTLEEKQFLVAFLVVQIQDVGGLLKEARAHACFAHDSRVLQHEGRRGEGVDLGWVLGQVGISKAHIVVRVRRDNERLAAGHSEDDLRLVVACPCLARAS